MFLCCIYHLANILTTPPPLEIVCSPIEHIDASEIINSPTHSMISNSSTIVASNPNPDMDIEQTLTDLEKAGSELIPQWIDMPNLPDLPNTSNPNLEVTMVNEHFSSNPQANSSYANALKSPRPRTPTLTDTNDSSPPIKLFNMMQDPCYLNSGHLPPILQPLKIHQIFHKFLVNTFMIILISIILYPVIIWYPQITNGKSLLEMKITMYTTPQKIMNNFSSGKIINSNHFISK